MDKSYKASFAYIITFALCIIIPYKDSLFPGPNKNTVAQNSIVSKQTLMTKIYLSISQTVVHKAIEGWLGVGLTRKVSLSIRSFTLQRGKRNYTQTQIKKTMPTQSIEFHATA